MLLFCQNIVALVRYQTAVCFEDTCGLIKHFNICVFLGSGNIQANVLPLEQICGLLGQMGLTIASGPPKTEHNVLQGSVTLAEHHLKFAHKADVALSAFV